MFCLMQLLYGILAIYIIWTHLDVFKAITADGLDSADFFQMNPYQ